MTDGSAPGRFDAGRTDPAAILADRLARGEPEYLEGALENPALDEDLVVVLLRNRGATPNVLRRIALDPRFRRSYAVRAGLVRHPGAPRAVSMNLVHHLFWRDLARAADDFWVPPPVRRVAVRVLASRLEEMSLGEQITLARTAGRSVLLALRQTRDERVAEALLQNPRMVEDDAVFLAEHPETPAAIRGLLARDRKWVRRYPVRAALVNHRRTPVGIALGLLTGLLRRDLEGIAARPDVPPVLRMAATRVLRSRRARALRAEEPGETDDAYVLRED